MNLTARIAIRHLRSKHNFGFISFSTFLSIIGLMLGISSLIIISCISDGFSNVINLKLSSIDGHIRVNSYLKEEVSESKFREIDSIFQHVTTALIYSTPYIEKHTIIKKGAYTEGIIVYGVPEKALEEIFQLDQFSQSESKFHSENDIIIGSKLAESINIKINEELIIFNPEKINTHQIFEAKTFTLANTFQTDFPEYDHLLAFIPLKTAQKYFGIGSKMSGLILTVDNPQEIEETDIILSDALGVRPYMTRTWKERHASLLAWLNIYDIPIKLIMFFITAVAVFNIGASLLMIIIEKTRDMGILQSMGLNKSNITYIILTEGAIIGISGSILGILFSLSILYLESVYHFIELPNDIYFMDYLPVQISPVYFILYPSITFIITLIFSYFPATKASNICPSEALRYE